MLLLELCRQPGTGGLVTTVWDFAVDSAACGDLDNPPSREGPRHGKPRRPAVLPGTTAAGE